MEIGPEKVGQARESILNEFLKDARIPGFRPGKAPMGANSAVASKNRSSSGT
ncbi:MAG: trigger factor family protein [Betaproteobacteria bacterium]|nr:trigger factor family protein [Betaproteobacteria bacterium]